MKCGASIAMAICLASGCGSSTKTITAPKDFWSGHWWPLQDVGRNMYDADDVTDRYWRFLQATRSPTSDVFRPPTATEQERALHQCTGTCSAPASDYCGHCNAWTAAAMMEPEPTDPITKTIIRYGTLNAAGQLVVGGVPVPIEVEELPPGIVVDTIIVVFEVGHQKGLLTELWWDYRSQMFGDVHGPGVPADEWHEAMESWEATGFAFEKEPGDPVWNFPVHEVTLRFKDRKRGETTIRDVEATVEYVRSVDEDFVGMATDFVTYQYRLEILRGTIRSGQWRGTTKPGAIWRPTSRESSGNIRVIDRCVREIIDQGTETIVIRSTADFRRWPCP